ncbi:MAG: phage terminase small subunit [[Clostridium] innocuum]
MPKKPDERIEPAKQMYLDGMKLIDIAKELDLPEGTVRRWKSTHKWDSERSDKKDANVRKKRGGQPGNKNATGPPGNQNARRHGLFAKYLPPGLNAIIDEMPEQTLDVMWDQIQIQYANILHAQKIMYVENKEDISIDVSMQGEDVTAYDIQRAWDKQAANLSAQSRAMKTLISMIKEYDELLHKNWDTASAIQKAQLEQIRAQTDKLTISKGDDEQLSKVDKILEEMQKDAERKAG